MIGLGDVTVMGVRGGLLQRESLKSRDEKRIGSGQMMQTPRDGVSLVRDVQPLENTAPATRHCPAPAATDTLATSGDFNRLTTFPMLSPRLQSGHVRLSITGASVNCPSGIP